MKKTKIIGKMLPKEVRENSGVKVGLALLTGVGAVISIIDIIRNGKPTFASIVGGGIALMTFNEAIEDVKEVIDEQ